MASGDPVASPFTPLHNLPPNWAFVAFTSGSVEPSLGDTIWGDTSDENGILEFISLESGTWGGGDAAGYMLLSNLSDLPSDWTSGENFTANSSTPANDGTLTGLPVECFAPPSTRNNKPTVIFDAAVNYVTMFQGFLARHYAGGGLTVTVSVMAATATSGDMSWKGFFLSVTPGADDLDTKNFAAPQSNQAVAAPGTSGQTVEFELTFATGAEMDLLVAGEWFYFLLMRDAQDATNDDMTGDAEFVGAEIQET